MILNEDDKIKGWKVNQDLKELGEVSYDNIKLHVLPIIYNLHL